MPKSFTPLPPNEPGHCAGYEEERQALLALGAGKMPKSYRPVPELAPGSASNPVAVEVRDKPDGATETTDAGEHSSSPDRASLPARESTATKR